MNPPSLQKTIHLRHKNRRLVEHNKMAGVIYPYQFLVGQRRKVFLIHPIDRRDRHAGAPIAAAAAARGLECGWTGWGGVGGGLSHTKLDTRTVSVRAGLLKAVLEADRARRTGPRPGI